MIPYFLKDIQHNVGQQMLTSDKSLQFPYSLTLYSVTTFFFSMALAAQSRAIGLLILEVFRDHTQRHTTFGRTPLDE